MQFGSVCSGIEAASVAWHPIGWKAAWLAEIEPFPCAVLAHHYPSVPNLGDMTTIARRVLTEEVPAPDVFCGGTPCQAFSVAGLRESLADERGNLTLKFVEIADAIDHVRVGRGEDECIVFWENVPGVLSTKDNAFGCFLAGLAGENDPLEPPGGKWSNAGFVHGPTRTVAWRTLDAQYFGVAQRRRRVFVVASARKGFDPAQVLFEWDGLRRDSAPSREAREVAPTIPARSTAGGGLGTDFDCDGGLQVAGTMKACKDSGGWSNSADHAAAGYMVPVRTLCVATGQAGAETGADMAPTLNCNHEAPYVARTLRGEGFDASEDGTGRGTPLVPVAYSIMPMNSGKDYKARETDIAQPLMAGGPVGGNQGGDFITQPVAFAENSRHELRLEGGDGQRTGALSTGGGKPGQGVPMIAFPANMSGTQCASAEDVCPALGAANPTAVGMFYAGQGAKAGSIAYSADVAPTLKASDSGTNRVPSAHIGMQVRRLTPVECERLMGFSDDYTAIPWRKKPADQCPDGPRYRALGNSWAIPCVSWIGERIARQINSSTTSPHPAGFFTTKP